MPRNFSAICLTYNMSVICWNSREAKTCWKCIHLFKLVSTKHLYDCYAKQWLAHFSGYCTSHLLLFHFSNLCCPPLKQCLFLLSYALFLKSKSNIFSFSFISMLRMNNLFFAFKNKNCRIYHECAFEFTD